MTYQEQENLNRLTHENRRRRLAMQELITTGALLLAMAVVFLSGVVIGAAL